MPQDYRLAKQQLESKEEEAMQVALGPMAPTLNLSRIILALHPYSPKCPHFLITAMDSSISPAVNPGPYLVNYHFRIIRTDRQPVPDAALRLNVW